MQLFKTWALSCTLVVAFASNTLASKASIVAEAKNLMPTVTSTIAQNFLDATANLPSIP
jgi:hypothetical protein